MKGSIGFTWNDIELTEENKVLYDTLGEAVKLRELYQDLSLQNNKTDKYSIQYDSFRLNKEGVFVLISNEISYAFAPTINKYYLDSKFISRLSRNSAIQSLCYRRLENLKHNFLMYKNLSTEKERIEQRKSLTRDFYKVVKVDTHVHHTASMNTKHLLKFIKNKLINSPNDLVYKLEDKIYTLKEIFMKLKIPEDNFCIDALETHAHTDTFRRFDKFNSKYNPYGQPILRDIFLKYDNYNKGLYLSEITKELFAIHEENKYLYYEYRISIYGKSKTEWSILADWVINNNLNSVHIEWLIQIPRLYNLLRSNNTIETFEDMLTNIFEPLFEVSLNPSVNPNLAKFLEMVVGFDCVDDESQKDKNLFHKSPLPKTWDTHLNPPYSYYMYFLYANITSLNHLRKSRNLNIFSFRPHSGEAGDVKHLANTFLTAQSIAHGIQLRKSMPLQYLYYICKIGIAMSPLSNNSLFLALENHPFYEFFCKGLNISVSTDDPLHFHFTKDPLMEEYSVITQVWKLSSVDQCELARNSVLQSNFSIEFKKQCIGENYARGDISSVDTEKTNIPSLRVIFRYSMWENEFNLIAKSEEEKNGLK